MTNTLSLRRRDTTAEAPTVFVVDDDTEACSELAEYLRGKGCSVVEFHDGLGAVNELRAHKPALVFMDIRMPLVDGIRAARRILSLRPETTVVLMSGYPKEVVRAMHAKEVDLDALTVLQKPLHLQELAAIVAGLLQRASSGRRLGRAKRAAGSR